MVTNVKLSPQKWGKTPLILQPKKKENSEEDERLEGREMNQTEESK